MSLDSYIQLGREKKVRRFANHFDRQTSDNGGDPLNPATAAAIAEFLAAAPEEQWKQLAKDMKEQSIASTESRLGVVNLYRVRAALDPLASLSGEPAPLPPLVLRYVELIDARTTRKGNDPHDVQTAEAIADLLGNYKSAGPWMTLKIALRERLVPDMEVRRAVVNVYRMRAGLSAKVLEPMPVRKCLAGCGKDARADSDVCSGECDVAILAEGRKNEAEAEKEEERERRFGGSRR